jgi:hypothetical protein
MVHYQIPCSQNAVLSLELTETFFEVPKLRTGSPAYYTLGVNPGSLISFPIPTAQPKPPTLPIPHILKRPIILVDPKRTLPLICTKHISLRTRTAIRRNRLINKYVADHGTCHRRLCIRSCASRRRKTLGAAVDIHTAVRRHDEEGSAVSHTAGCDRVRGCAVWEGEA